MNTRSWLGAIQGLSNHLCALRFGIACEVRDIERHRGPKTDHPGQRWNEETHKFRRTMKLARHVQHGAESARFACNPKKKKQSHHEHERRANPFEELDRFDPAPDHHHVDGPEEKETDPVATGKICCAGPYDSQHRVDGLPSNPCLNAEPAASYERAQDCRNIRSADAKRG